jgi:hypothetical protein
MTNFYPLVSTMTQKNGTDVLLQPFRFIKVTKLDTHVY